jgi:hypothetical protein
LIIIDFATPLSITTCWLFRDTPHIDTAPHFDTHTPAAYKLPLDFANNDAAAPLLRRHMIED